MSLLSRIRNLFRTRGRLMRSLIGVQVALCFLVLFAAGLLASTFRHLSTQSTGFSSERLLTLETTAAQPQPIEFWDQVTQHLRNTASLESAASAGWPILKGTGWNGFIWVDGKATEVMAYFLSVSPGWVEMMDVRLLDGRDLRNTETSPGAALVNEAFVQQCFHGRNPIGQWFEKESGDGITRICEPFGLIRRKL